MAHAYFVVAGTEEGVAKAERFADASLGITGRGSPDLVTLRFSLFSVEDARKLLDIAVAAPIGDHKVVIVSLTRFFHEAQNALLKLFEEPPANTTLILIVPSEGMLLSTLRSRLAPLPDVVNSKGEARVSELARSFLRGDVETREKLIGKLVDRSKSDKDEEKQQARSEAVRLAEDLLRVAAKARTQAGTGEKEREFRSLIEDLTHFLPLLHTRSAPLKLVFEHLLLVIPKGLKSSAV